MRGENNALARQQQARLGTSPRARGKLNHLITTCELNRNIPACAGKTYVPLGGCGFPEEHPRVRGENISKDKFCEQRCGTSPRARGKLPLTECQIKQQRNIPACAGKTTHPHIGVVPI